MTIIQKGEPMDLIDRQAAIDAVEFGITYARAFNKETGEVKELFQESNDELRKAVERIEQLPPIQPKRGKWHYSDGKPARIGLSFGVVCDQCGTESEYCTNFCGECGADMRGDKNA